jgi:hypothetical protein
MRTKKGKAIPMVDSIGWSVGFKWSLYPTNSITMTVATLAPVSICTVNFFNWLITTDGSGQTTFSSLPSSDYRIHSFESYRE